MRAARRWCVVAMAIIASLTACIAPQTTKMVGVDVRSWRSAESLIYNNGDTLSLRDLGIALRYNTNFKSSAIPLKLVVMTPDSLFFEDSIVLYPRHPRSTISVATTECLPYRTDVLLNKKGDYTFTFEPYEEVRGLEALGIDIA